MAKKSGKEKKEKIVKSFGGNFEKPKPSPIRKEYMVLNIKKDYNI